MRLLGQAALVTGGASGLGAATASALAAAGARVTVLDVNADLAAQVAREIGGLAVACDVSNATSAEGAVAQEPGLGASERRLIRIACAAGWPVPRFRAKPKPWRTTIPPRMPRAPARPAAPVVRIRRIGRASPPKTT